MESTQVVAAASKGVIPALSKLASVLRTRLHKKHLATLQEAIKVSAGTAIAAPLASAEPNESAQIAAFCQSSAFSDACYQVLLIESVGSAMFSDSDLRDLVQRQLQFYVTPDSAERWSPCIAATLMQAANMALSNDAYRGLLSESRLQTEAHARLVEQLLSGISHRLQTIEQVARTYTTADIEAFEKKYRGQVQARYRKITPPNFGSPRSVAFSKVYVAPTLVCGDEVVPLGDFISDIHRTVVVGDPGGGKTTLATRIILDATSASGLYGKNIQLTPFIVTLREYAARKDIQPMSILEFLEETAKSRFQMGEVPPKLTDFLLSTGRAILVFDGLDELLDTTRRQEIVQDVELFCSLYSTTPVLVTSRAVGYEEAPLDQELFQVYKLAKFSDEQVQEYARKWFANSTDIPTDERVGTATQFVKESRPVSDLTANPLMLSLMCNLYRGERYIPRNRPDLYEKCATLLFERWDKQRKIVVPLPIESHIRPAMMAIAYQILESPGLQEGVPRSQLESMAARYLLQAKYDNEDRARSTASEFIDFCTGRAWVFTNTGSSEVEELYQFTHRTFLEFFAASHLVRTRRTPNDLAGVLLPRVAAAEWDVVSQLAFQIMAKQLDGAADELLELAVDFQRLQEGRRRYNVLSFSARCLAFLVPREVTVRLLVSELVCVAFDADLLSASGARDRVSGSRLSPDELICALFGIAEENHDPALESLKGEIHAAVQAGNAVALDLCASGLASGTRAEAASSSVDVEWAESLRKLARSTARKRTRSRDGRFLARRSGAIYAFEAGELSAAELLELHDVRDAFIPIMNVAVLAYLPPEAIRFLGSRQLGALWNEWGAEVLKRVAATSPPWFAVNEVASSYCRHMLGRDGPRPSPGWGGLRLSKHAEDSSLALAECLFVLAAFEAELMFEGGFRGPRVEGEFGPRLIIEGALVFQEGDMAAERAVSRLAYGAPNVWGYMRELERTLRRLERQLDRIDASKAVGSVRDILQEGVDRWLRVAASARGVHRS